MKRRTVSAALLCASLAAAQSITSSGLPSTPTKGYCYQPDPNGRGLTAQNDRPCDPDAETSMCCPSGWTCMSNKICQFAGGSLPGAVVGDIRRSTCTNPQWNDTVCGNFCLRLPQNQLQGDLIPCGNNVFVCAADAAVNNASCADGLNTFNVGIGFSQTVIPLPASTASSTVSSTASASSLSASTLATSARPSSSGNSTAQPLVSEDDDEKDRTRKIAIGAGVGGAVVVLLGLALFFILFRRHRKRKAKAGSRGSSSIAPFVDSDVRETEDHVPIHTTFINRTDDRASTPPPGDLVAPDSDPDDGRGRHHLVDDGETEISSGPLPGTAAASGAPSRHPEYLTSGDRELAQIHGRTYVGDGADGARVTSPPPVPEVTSAAGGPGYAHGSRGDLADYGPPPAIPPAGGRVSPFNDRRPAGF